MLLRANLAIVVFVGLMSLATSPFTLLALRLIQGIFSGFIAPSLTLVSVQTPADRQGRVAGLLHTSFLAGGVLIGSLASLPIVRLSMLARRYRREVRIL